MTPPGGAPGGRGKFCPEGHTSQSQDYCDVCGLPMEVDPPAAAVPAPSVSPPEPTATTPDEPAEASGPSTVECAHCGTRNAAANLFCENCGYDFTTGALPERIPLADGTYLPGPSAATAQDTTPDSEPNADPAEPLRPGDAAGPSAPDQRARPAPAPRPAAHPPAEPSAPVDTSMRADRPTYRPASQPPRSGWVAEVWIDPVWFDLQEGDGTSPSPGPPDIVVLPAGGAVVGRPSRSQGFVPDVDCGTDSAVSRRHARLTTDGRRWWVEDLDSSNGTFVGDATEPPPLDPIEPQRRVEIDADDRIWLGAWTRLVVRPAVPTDHLG